jgi:GntR family transcriptional regulator
MSESIGARPPYLLLVDDLRARIDSGKLPPGAQLPSTATLMAEFEVSTQTVQHAIRVLKTEGLVEGLRGKGVFVRERQELVSRTPPTDEGDPHQDGVPTVVDVWKAKPPKDVAAVLGLSASEKVAIRQTLLAAEGSRQPAEIVTSYYPLDVAGGTGRARVTPPDDGSTAELRRLGFAPHHVTEVVQARMPTPAEARTLWLSAGVAVFRVLRSVHAEDGRVLEVTDIVLSGDRYQLRYELPIHD